MSAAVRNDDELLSAYITAARDERVAWEQYKVAKRKREKLHGVLRNRGIRLPHWNWKEVRIAELRRVIQREYPDKGG